ncbi:amino acid adenylation domain-containing protein [Streptomyces sp. NBC_00654]|uniref:amino acid adenylation domain-containing protein n=1 Tax=Streptomyces sp. NBC_00654 TaxID=2975799 RepID=UPI00225B9FDB|nr:amino acid adenylation domain-containing protein [Streptomyces sp. NBC_00654]MCX4967390.1 amino acid adenylation domain-containing protein [Streptomyces sp. NBC_00654]
MSDNSVQAFEEADLAEYLDAAAERSPLNRAVVGPDGQSQTYGEFSAQVDRVATVLHGRGVGQGDRVGVLMPKSVQSVTLIHGILRLGAAYVPVDAHGSPQRAATIFEDCQARLILADERSAGRLGEAAPSLTTRTLITDGSWPGADASGEPDYPRAEKNPDRLAALLYTSGSTGTPKGVMITHRNAVAFVEWASATFGITEADEVASHAPFHFDLSVFDLFVTVKHAACVHLIDTDLAASPRHLPTFIAESGITVWYSAPAILGMIAESPRAERFPRNRLRLVLFAGEVFPIDKLRRLLHLWPTPRYYNLYGPTETNVCTYYPVPEQIPASRTDPLSIGHACSHCDVIVVNEQLEPVPSGQSGFLSVAGPSVYPSYWNMPARTAERTFHFGGRRWYNTGDIVRATPEGYVFLGRADRMVKRHGHRIELDEIEHSLRHNEALADAAVVSTGVPGDVTITAFVVAPGAAPTGVELRQYCHSRLARYMVPDDFQFLDELPRTSTGKTDYQELSSRCQVAEAMSG